MFKRFRRLRINPILRDLVQEVHIQKDDFIYPLFVKAGKNIKNEIPSMPGVFQISLDKLKDEIKDIKAHGIKAIILFGIPEIKDSIGSDALCE